MVNFTRLKRLISECEDKNDSEQRYFFARLKGIAEEELRLKQVNLGGWFR